MSEETSVKLDVKETKEVLLLAFGLGKVIKEAKTNDGKFTGNDLMLLGAVYPKFGPALDGIDKVPAELKDIDLEEAKELQDLVIKEFGELIDQAKLVEQINLGLKAVIALVAFVKSFKD